MTAFLVGGPANSGTTLLTLLLNQPGMVCLDEPDFQKPEPRTEDRANRAPGLYAIGRFAGDSRRARVAKTEVLATRSLRALME